METKAMPARDVPQSIDGKIAAREHRQIVILEKSIKITDAEMVLQGLQEKLDPGSYTL